MNLNLNFRSSSLATDFKYENPSIPSTDWSLEEGYKTSDFYVHPRRVLGPGALAGLSVVFKVDISDFDYVCRGSVQGFRILLNTPGDISRVGKQYFRVPLHQEIVVSVKPNMISTSHTLDDYTPDRRQCFFNHERELKFFKVYSQNNCEFECLVNATLARCNCVKFSMPRDNDTNICTHNERFCYDETETDLMKEALNLSLKSGRKKKSEKPCNCLPSCTSISYDTEISQGDFDYDKAADEEGNFSNVVLGRLTIFFKEPQFITSKRSELYGVTDFMANVGGLLGELMTLNVN